MGGVHHRPRKTVWKSDEPEQHRSFHEKYAAATNRKKHAGVDGVLEPRDHLRMDCEVCEPVGRRVPPAGRQVLRHIGDRAVGDERGGGTHVATFPGQKPGGEADQEALRRCDRLRRDHRQPGLAVSAG